jgi:WD40 repeat protein
MFYKPQLWRFETVSRVLSVDQFGEFMELIRRIELEDAPGKIKFSRDGSRFLVITQERITSCTIEGTIETKPIETIVVFDAAYINNERIIASTLSQERQFELAIFDIKSGSIISRIHVGDSRIYSVCFDPIRQRIHTGKLDDFAGEISTYDLTLTLQSEFKTLDLYMPFDMAISHFGDKLAIAGVLVGVWDISGKPRLISEECLQESDCTGTPCEVNSLDMTPDGRYVVAGFHGAKGLCAVIDTESGKVIGWYGPRGDEINYYATSALAIAPKGDYVAVAIRGSPKIALYKVEDGSLFLRHDSHEYGDIAFSPTANILAIGGEKSVSLYRFDG